MIINGDGGYGLLAAYVGGPVAQADWLGPKVGGHLAPLYSSREPSELSQWLCYDDSTISSLASSLRLHGSLTKLSLLLSLPMFTLY